MKSAKAVLLRDIRRKVIRHPQLVIHRHRAIRHPRHRAIPHLGRVHHTEAAEPFSGDAHRRYKKK